MSKKRMPSRAVLIAGGAILIAILAVVLVLAGRGPATSGAIEYAKVRVSASVDQTVIEASGNIEAIKASDLSFNGAGLVAAVLVAEGQVVAKGRVLASLDDSSEAYSLANARYKLEQARLSGNVRSAELAELEMRVKEADLARTRLSAPFSGIVTDVNAAEGEYVSSGDTVLSMIDRSSLLAVLEIDEIDLPSVRVGQIVQFEFDALPKVIYRGAVSRIPPTGRVTSQGLAVFDVEATIADPPSELLPGYSFAATIQASEARNILSIPSAAVFPAPSDGGTSADAGKGGESASGPEAKTPVATSGIDTSGAPAALPADPEARRAAIAAMSDEQRAALRTRMGGTGTGRSGSGAGSGPGATLTAGGAQTGAEGAMVQAAAALAVYVPGEKGEPVLRRITGVPRSDNTVEVLSGLESGDYILVPKSGSNATGNARSSGGLLPEMRFISGPGPAGPQPTGGARIGG